MYPSIQIVLFQFVEKEIEQIALFHIQLIQSIIFMVQDSKWVGSLGADNNFTLMNERRPTDIAQREETKV